MTKKAISLLLLIAALFSLTACTSSTQKSTQSSSTGASPTELQRKLAVGTLKLEKTDLAVTAEQAKTLLPLWKGVKSLTADTAASADELTALYAQIQDSMTADQIKAIEQMTISQQDLGAMMKEMGVTAASGSGFGGLSDAERATRIAKRQSSGSSAGGPGGPPPGDMMGGGMPGGQTTTQTTRVAGQGNGNGSSRMYGLFVEPLIKLLTERAAS